MSYAHTLPDATTDQSRRMLTDTAVGLMLPMLDTPEPIEGTAMRRAKVGASVAMTTTRFAVQEGAIYPHPFRAFARSFWNAILSLRHPFKTTIIDVSTGDVMDEY